MDLKSEVASVKAFVVSSGNYSDYHIEAVFSSYEKAEAYIAPRLAFDDTYAVRMFELDAEPIRDRVTGMVVMDRDGNGAWTYEDDGCPGTLVLERDFGHISRKVVCCVRAREREQAIKAANELRTRAIALNLIDFENPDRQECRP